MNLLPRYNSRTATRSERITTRAAMPAYLFTYHAYGSWLPNRKRGYIQRGAGIQPTNLALASRYRKAMKETEVSFDAQQQRCLVKTILDSQEKQQFRCRGVATDACHLHTPVSWIDDRQALPMRAAVKSSLSRAMKKTFGKRTWLSEGGSRKRVRERGHFDYLLEHYLPKHRGLIWIEGKGFL